MRNECQDMLMDARCRLAARDYDGSLLRSQRLLGGSPHCSTCPYDDECWISALSLIGEVFGAQSQARSGLGQRPAE